MKQRTPERIEFLYFLMHAAIDHAGYGFPETTERHFNDDAQSESYAVIFDRYEAEESWVKTSGWRPENWKPETTWRVDIDMMAKGLGIARKLADVSPWVKDLLLADRTNGDDGDYDVVGALLVLECAIFGKPTYN